MARAAFVALGVVEALFPARITDLYEKLAHENPDDGVRKEWLLSVVRAEGIVVGVVSLLGGRGYAWLLNLMGFAGAVAACFPSQYHDFATRLIYENPDQLESTDRFPTIIRGLGVLYMFVSLRAWKRRRSTA